MRSIRVDRMPCLSRHPWTAAAPPVFASCYRLLARFMSVFTISHAATIPSTNNTTLSITKRLDPQPFAREVRIHARTGRMMLSCARKPGDSAVTLRGALPRAER